MSHHQLEGVDLCHHRLIEKLIIAMVVFMVVLISGALAQSGMQSIKIIRATMTLPHIDVQVQTDKPTYYQGDILRVLITATNPSDTSVTMNFSTACQFNYCRNYWCLHSSPPYNECGHTPSQRTLEPHSSFTWIDEGNAGGHLGLHHVTAWIGEPDSTQGIYGKAETTFNVVHPPIDIRVQTDRGMYLPSDTIKLSINAKNLTDSTIVLYFPSSGQYDFWVDTSICFMGTCWGLVTQLTLQSHDSITWRESWPGLNLSIGDHQLIGLIGNPPCLFPNDTMFYGTDTTHFYVVPDTPNYSLRRGWNLVSLPFSVSDSRVTSLFGEEYSQAFYYQGIYKRSDSVLYGRGYWLNSLTNRRISVVGNSVYGDTIGAANGWNIIGSFPIPIPVSQLTSEPPGMGMSNFYGYSTSYYIADTIYPGKGYWVKSGQSGKIILSSNPSRLALSKNTIRIIPTTELPPPPPEIEVNVPGIPKDYAIDQAFPNPFNPTTTMKYQLPSDSKVNLRIFNVLGQLEATLVDDIQDAGYKSVKWNATGISSGVYIYWFEASNMADPSQTFTQTGKILLMR